MPISAKAKNIFPNGAVSLCFDDGWRCIYDNALPVLTQAGLCSTHYIISGCLDDRQFPRYMNLEQILDLQARGHEIGSHTVSHKHLLQETDEIIREEIVLAKRFLEESGVVVTTFAYPYGEYSDRIVALVKETGFQGARRFEPGYNTIDSNIFLLDCQAMKIDTSFSELANWLQMARSTHSWLILVFHQVDYQGREWSTTPEMLVDIVNQISSLEITVITVAEGISKLLPADATHQRLGTAGM